MEFNYNLVHHLNIDLIKPNPFQPRINFDDGGLRDLAESIKHYGILQPITVILKEQENDNYFFELISGERRLRASKLIGLKTVLAIVKKDEFSSQEKLELAILENLQREDLNPIDRALAFKKLIDRFNFRHIDIARKIGKSREFVSNSLRILNLPDKISIALAEGKITDGHGKSLLMLIDKPVEQNDLFNRVLKENLTVRQTNALARKIAIEKIRKRDINLSPETLILEKKLSDFLGTRVSIVKNIDNSGLLTINFFSEIDLKKIKNVILNSGDEILESNYQGENNNQLSEELDIKNENENENQLSRELNSESDNQSNYQRNYNFEIFDDDVNSKAEENDDENKPYNFSL